MTGSSAEYGGAYKPIAAIWAESGGVYKSVLGGWAESGGLWKPFYNSFTPHTDTYDTPGSFSTTVPFGATSVTMYATGGGGGGENYPTNGYLSGAGGGTAIGTYSLVLGDWGGTINFVVPAGGAYGDTTGGTGGTATVSGVFGGSSRSLSGYGGAAAQFTPFAYAVGGTATGGTTNENGGNAAQFYSGSSHWGSGKYTYDNPHIKPTDPGVGGYGTNSGGPPYASDGASGRVRFVWS